MAHNKHRYHKDCKGNSPSCIKIYHEKTDLGNQTHTCVWEKLNNDLREKYVCSHADDDKCGCGYEDQTDVYP